MLGGIRFRSFQLLALAARLIPVRRTQHYDVVIVRVDAIGDWIIWRDTLDAYQRKFKGKKVLLVCADIVAALARMEPVFTDILEFNRRKFEGNLSHFWHIYSQLRRVSTDCVLCPAWERHRTGDLMVWAIRAKEKTGVSGIGRKNIEWKLYNHAYSTLLPNPDTISEINAAAYFTRTVIDPDYRYGMRTLYSSIPPPRIDKPYAVIAVSASDNRKIWDTDRFARVIDAIPDHYRIVLTGAGTEDIARAERISSTVRNPGRIVDLINRTDIPSLVSVIAGAAFVIGNDSAAVHIAAATRVRSVCILPGAHYDRFIPYPDETAIPRIFLPRPVCHQMPCFGCGYNCIHPVHARYLCLQDVSVEDVLGVLNGVLEELNAAPATE